MPEPGASSRRETERWTPSSVKGLAAGTLEGRLLGKCCGFGKAAGQEAGSPRGTEKLQGGVHQKGFGPRQRASRQGSDLPAESEVLQWPQDSGQPGGKQEVMTAGVEGGV